MEFSDSLAASEMSRSKAKGRLKIYLGMAAGVGKTYSMLSDAHEDVLRGLDVVVGYAETHGRIETERVKQGLESLPLKTIEYKGVQLEEFDLSGALIRKPDVILIDELAHTNAPGSIHSKRWQDIEDLVEAGIEVRTAVNIQHIESLRDVVAQITGVFVQETVPDAFIEKATDIELVDLPPDELHQRLKDGKVYSSEKIDKAIEGFFKKSHLLALRELALRHTADRVDEEMRRSKSAVSDVRPWHTNERILACIAPNRMAPRVVRAAKRLSASLHSEWMAICIESPRQAMAGERGRQLSEEALRLAESIGAKTARISADDIVSEVLKFARDHQATTIVMGKPIRPRWRELIFGSVVDSLIRGSGDIDVLVITGEEAHGAPVGFKSNKSLVSWRSFTGAAALVAGATGIGFLMVGRFDLANIVMVYLLATTTIAFFMGRYQALAATLASVLIFDYCFVPPRWSFAVSDVQFSITLLTMLVVSATVSSLASKLKSQSEASSVRERTTSTLYELSKLLSVTKSREEMAHAAAESAFAVAQAPVAVFVPDKDGKLALAASAGENFGLSANELAVATWVFDHGAPAGKGGDTLAGAQGFYLPLISAQGQMGVLGLDLRGGRPLRLDTQHLLEAIANQLAGALERYGLGQASFESQLRADSERLRSDLLSSVSHDLRTPLAAIQGAASSLQQNPKDPEAPALLKGIIDESERMSRLIRNLLDMTQIDSGSVVLKPEWESLEELVGEAVNRMDSFFDSPIQTLFHEHVPLVKVDPSLIEQALLNLLENAANHAGRAAKVLIEVGRTDSHVWISVADDGPGIPPGQEKVIFDKYKGGGSTGFGLGLAIVRAIAESHKGSATARNLEGGGVEFLLNLPVVEEPLPQ